MLLVAVALSLGSLELYHALQRHGMKAADPADRRRHGRHRHRLLPGRHRSGPVVFSTTSVLLAALALTVLAA